jgi:YD repeat-containing protein
MLSARLCHTSKDGTWSTRSEIAPILYPYYFTNFDFGIDSKEILHFAFASTDGDVRYRTLKDGTLSPPERVSLLKPYPSSVRIAIDSQDIPHVMWSSSSSCNSYAARINNPAQEDPWGRQEPAGGEWPGVIDEFKLSRVNDSFCYYACWCAEFSWTYEPNLGEQDPFTQFDFGPNSSANIATGNLFFSLPLFTTRGLGFSTSLTLTYNSQDPSDSGLSVGWNHNLGITLTDHAYWWTKVISVKFGDGRTVVFERDPAGTFVAQPDFGNSSIIQKDVTLPDGTYAPYLLTTKFGIKYIFDSSGRLSQIRDTQHLPNRLTLIYGDNPKSNISESTLAVPERLLVKIIDSTGRETTLSYDSHNRLEKIIDPAGGSYLLSYNTRGRLERVTFDAEGISWRFEYNQKGLLWRIYTPRGVKEDYFWEYEYYPDNRIRSCREPLESHIDEDGKKISLRAERRIIYHDPAPRETPSAIFVNRRGHRTHIEYQYRRAIATKITDPLNHTIERTPDEYRNIIIFRDKRGNITRYTYSTDDPVVKDNLLAILRPGLASPIRYTYTGFNRVESVTDEKGNTTSYRYDPYGNLKEIIYPPADTIVKDFPAGTRPLPLPEHISARESFEYDNRGRITRSISPRGAVTTYEYEDPVTGLVTSIKRPEHKKAEIFRYDPMGNLTDHILPEEAPDLLKGTHFELDGLYRLRCRLEPRIEIHTDPETTIIARPETIFQYDEDSNLVELKDPRGNITRHSYDRLGRLIATEGPAGNRMEFFYDPEGNTRIIKDFRGNVTIMKYDPLNRLIEEKRPGPPEMITTFEYDPNGNLIKEIRSGRTPRSVEYSYDARNNLICTLYPEGIRDLNTYDPNDNLILTQRCKDERFIYGTYNEYDQRNRLIATTRLSQDPGPAPYTIIGSTTRFYYDASNNRRAIADPLSNVSAFNFDLAECLSECIDPRGTLASRIIYNENDLRMEVMIPDPRIPAGAPLVVSERFTYNARNDLVGSFDALGNKTTYCYDASGNLVLKVDPEGAREEFYYDERNLLIKHIRYGASRIITSYSYDPNGNRTKIIDPKGYEYLFEYDRANRLVRLTSPLSSESWWYNEFGELERHIDPNGKIASFEYDLLGRLVREVHENRNGRLAEIIRGYDGASNLVLMEDLVSGLSICNKYDHLNRLTHTSWLNGEKLISEVSYQYDSAGNRTHMEATADQIFQQVNYRYDENNRLKYLEGTHPVLDDDITYKTLSAHISYTDGGLKSRVMFSNNVSIDYRYNLRQELSELITSAPSTSTFSHILYTYDSAGNRTHMEATAGQIFQ